MRGAGEGKLALAGNSRTLPGQKAVRVFTAAAAHPAARRTRLGRWRRAWLESSRAKQRLSGRGTMGSSGVFTFKKSRVGNERKCQVCINMFSLRESTAFKDHDHRLLCHACVLYVALSPPCSYYFYSSCINHTRKSYTQID